MNVQQQQAAGELAWRLVQLRLAAEEARALAERVIEGLSECDVEAITSSGSVTIDPDLVRAAVASVADAQEAAELLSVIVADMTCDDHPLTFAAEVLAGHAADALSSGTGHAGTARLCARLLPRSQGFAALADMLDGESCLVSGWGGLSVVELLTSFRDVDGALARGVCDDAAIAPDALWSDLSEDSLARVAAALRAAAG